MKKPGLRLFGVTIDLTKRRYAVLNFAKGIINNYPEENYVFADANLSLAIRLGNEYLRYFNNEFELNKILYNLRYVEV